MKQTFSGGTMSSLDHDTETQSAVQEIDLNDYAWNEMVATHLPANLEEQARHYKAWSRKGLHPLG
jgi:hypothetical protein